MSSSSTQVAKKKGIRRYEKRPLALMFAYNGAGYTGLQLQLGSDPAVSGTSVEYQLIRAMHSIGMLPLDKSGRYSDLRLSRAARTDKGVHALFQIMSLQAFIVAPLEDLPRALNRFLPANRIRVMAVVRVGKNFVPKHACSGRTYEYALPTYVLRTNRQANGNEQSIGHEKESIVEPIDGEKESVVEPASGDGDEKESIDEPIDEKESDDDETLESILERLNLYLSRYAGSHLFHNFTKGRPWFDVASRRVIFSFRCSEPMMVDGVEFVRLEVRGQSFMIYQIRKMVGYAVQLMRARAPVEAIDWALQPSVHMPVAPAPAYPLLLRQCHFDQYFARPAFKHLNPLLFDELRGELDAFRRQVLYPHIARVDRAEQGFDDWLACVAHERFAIDFDALRAQASGPTPQKPPRDVVKRTREKLSENNDAAVRRRKTRRLAMFRAAKLPFDSKAFEPLVSASAINYHYGSEHAAVVNQLNVLTSFALDIKGEPLPTLAAAESTHAAVPTVHALAAAALSHDLFWHSLAPDTDEQGAQRAPAGALAALVDAAAGTDALRQRIVDAALALPGSGFVFVLYDRDADELRVVGDRAAAALAEPSPFPLRPSASIVPLLALDCWEHSYLAPFGNDLRRYVVEFFWRYANWAFAEQQLSADNHYAFSPSSESLFANDNDDNDDVKGKQAASSS
jgi:tRNA pseudouridine38-40 synthase